MWHLAVAGALSWATTTAEKPISIASTPIKIRFLIGFIPFFMPSCG
jgi:hypothetical protein